jgi:hypothetical protein
VAVAAGTAKRLIEARARKLEEASLQHVKGVPLDTIKGTFDIRRMRIPFPILGCLCVQDSPENPCRCPNLVLWLPTFPKAVSATGDRNDRGDEYLDFALDRDAAVFVEMQVPIRLGALERVAKRARRWKRGDRVVAGHATSGTRGDGSPGSVARAAPPDLGWLGLAAGVGWAVGTLLDDLLGSNEGGNDNLSDDLSDWAADNFPAPDWMQDIF